MRVPLYIIPYYPDCLTIYKGEFIPNTEECVEYVKIYPNATGQNIVYALTATPAERLLDKQFGQIAHVEDNPDATPEYILSIRGAENLRYKHIEVYGEPVKT